MTPKVFGAFLLGVILTLLAVKLMPAPEPTLPPVITTRCEPAGTDGDELSDPRVLDTKLDAIEREITADPIQSADREALRQAILVER